MTKAMYAVLDTRRGWRDMLMLTEQAKAEISFWLTGSNDFDTKPMWHKASAVRVVYSDASDTSYDGYIVEHGPYMYIHVYSWCDFCTYTSKGFSMQHILPDSEWQNNNIPKLESYFDSFILPELVHVCLQYKPRYIN